MQVYHNPKDDEKELKRIEMLTRLKVWFLKRWEEIRSIWLGLKP